MMTIIIKMIEESSISNSRKKELISYTESLISKNLPVFFDRYHICSTLNIPNKKTIFEFVNDETLSYLIEKRSGDYRIISSPNYYLKQAQRWILDNLLVHVSVSKFAHGFVKNRSIVTNASSHIHQENFWVLNMDIKDFFSSISKKNVCSLFMKIGYNVEVAESLAELCTYGNCLAQGFPTSPHIANLYLNQFDELLGTLVKEFDQSIVYTRYADDLVFSGIKKKGYTKCIHKIIEATKLELAKLNLSINKKKTRVQ